MKNQNIQIVSNGETLFTGILNDFVEGFVLDEKYFYKQLRLDGMKTFPNIKTFWSDNQKEIEVRFNLS